MLVILWIKLFHRYFISINLNFFQECMTSSIKHVCVNVSMDVQNVNKPGHLFATNIFLLELRKKKEN